MVVQKRYEVLRAMFMHETEDQDPYLDVPAPDTPEFQYIDLMLQTATPLLTGNWEASAEVYETGKLRYGNANPEASDFDSLADYMFTGDGVEIRIPWQLLNFANPSEMMIHDDYYEHYGVEYLHIDEMWVGFSWGEGNEYRIPMAAFPLEGWGWDVTYHERLKRSYYILQDYWAGLDGRAAGRFSERRCAVGAEVLLYGYGLVCISMLVFNLLYSLHLRAGQRRMMRRMAVLRRRVEAQLRGIQNDLTGQNAQSIQVKHLTWLRRRLSRVSYLLAFDRFLDEQDGRDRAFQTYIRQIQRCFYTWPRSTGSGRIPRRPIFAISWRGTASSATWRWTRSSRRSSPI